MTLQCNGNIEIVTWASGSKVRKMISPGSATLATTVQRGERVADADVPVRYHEEFIFY